MENLLFAASPDPGQKKKTVFVKANFLKVAYVDTIKQEFRGEVFVQTRWREPALDNAKETDFDASKFWNARIVIGNVVSTLSSKTRSEVQMYGGEAFIVEKRRINGVFAESLELHEYPFDIQDLSIVVTSELSDAVMDIVEDHAEISAVHMMCFVDVTEWTIRDLVYMEQFHVPTSGQQFRNPVLLVKCIAMRKMTHFMLNIILIAVLISTLSFTTFSVHVVQTASRLKLSFVTTLTAVTFKLLASRTIPKIPYLTHADRLILGGMMFNWLVAVWHAAISQFHGNQHQQRLDFWALIAFIALFTLLHLGVFISAFIQRTKRKHELTLKEKAYQNKVAAIMGRQFVSDRAAQIPALAKRDTLNAARLLRLED